MSAVTTESVDPTTPSAANGVVVFTPRGEAALDQLATVLTAHCSGTPEGIAKVLDQVMHADMADLAEALTAIAEASEHRAGPGREVPGFESPDAAARRRLGRRDAMPAAGQGPVPSVGR
jgi:hypothetical protein